jgi:hypothetical protein
MKIEVGGGEVGGDEVGGRGQGCRFGESWLLKEGLNTTKVTVDKQHVEEGVKAK